MIGWQVNILVTHSSRHCLCSKCNEPIYSFSLGVSYGTSLKNTLIFEIFPMERVIVCPT
jgi:hypothetical protein